MNIIWILLFGTVKTVLAQDANCDFYNRLRAGASMLFASPQYPNNYARAMLCRWTFDCPEGYNCRLECPEISLPQSQSCSLDRFLLSRSGDPSLSNAEKYCGRGSLTASSTGQRISIGLITNQDTTGGRFTCTVSTQRIEPNTQCFCGRHRQNRIVGGKETGINEYPMMVGLVDLSIKEIKCGGAIISEYHVLTAAHCVIGKRNNDIAVIVGEHDVTTGDSSATKGYQVENIITHNLFTENNYDYDVAILRTVQRMEFSDRVGPVCLPFKYAGNSEDWLAGNKVTILGWGTIFIGGPKSNVLLKADVDVITQSQCRRNVSTLTSRQLCTYTKGKDSCQDDSGGPALYTDPQTGLLYNIGIVSYGRSCASNEPGVNTRVTSVLQWIKTNSDNYNFCVK